MNKSSFEASPAGACLDKLQLCCGGGDGASLPSSIFIIGVTGFNQSNQMFIVGIGGFCDNLYIFVIAITDGDPTDI